MRPISETGFNLRQIKSKRAAPVCRISACCDLQIKDATAIGLRCDADARFMECDQSRTGRVRRCRERGSAPNRHPARCKEPGKGSQHPIRFAFEFESMISRRQWTAIRAPADWRIESASE